MATGGRAVIPKAKRLGLKPLWRGRRKMFWLWLESPTGQIVAYSVIAVVSGAALVLWGALIISGRCSENERREGHDA